MSACENPFSRMPAAMDLKKKLSFFEAHVSESNSPKPTRMSACGPTLNVRLWRDPTAD